VLANNSGTSHYCNIRQSRCYIFVPADNLGTTHYCPSKVLVPHIFVLADSSGTSHCATSRLYVLTFSVACSDGAERSCMGLRKVILCPLTLSCNYNFQYDVSVRCTAVGRLLQFCASLWTFHVFQFHCDISRRALKCMFTSLCNIKGFWLAGCSRRFIYARLSNANFNCDLDFTHFQSNLNLFNIYKCI